MIETGRADRRVVVGLEPPRTNTLKPSIACHILHLVQARALYADPFDPFSSVSQRRQTMKGAQLRIAVSVLVGVFSIAGCSSREEIVAPGVPEISADAAPLIQSSNRARVVPGSYIVVLRLDGHSGARSPQSVATEHGLRPRRHFGHALRGFSTQLNPIQLDRLRHDRRVQFVEENQYVELYGSQQLGTNLPMWGLDVCDQFWTSRDRVYNYDFTGTAVYAYVIDTGVRADHTEFRPPGGQSRVIQGHPVPPEAGTEDNNGHGTSVAGIIGGAICGVAKNVTIVPVKVGDPYPGNMTTESIIAAVDWVTWDHVMNSHGPAVANLSLGLGGNDPEVSPSPAMDAAVRASIASGVVYVIAAGNGYSGNGRPGVSESAAAPVDARCFSPARVEEAITVGGALNTTDTYWYSSNTGPVIDVLAPGQYVMTASRTGFFDYRDDFGYTSCSTAFVTGAVALYLESNPFATPAQVAEVIRQGARPSQSSVPILTTNRVIHTRMVPTLSVQVHQVQTVGSNLVYTLKATAGVGNYTYSFTWLNGATPIAPFGGNVSWATRVVPANQTVRVTCRVLSGAATESSLIVLNEDPEEHDPYRDGF